MTSGAERRIYYAEIAIGALLIAEFGWWALLYIGIPVLIGAVEFFVFKRRLW